MRTPMLHVRRIRSVALLAALIVCLTRASLLAAESLPTDPAIVSGTLDNGFTYLIRKHGNPAGRVSFWLHVASGSLNETESTRGIAHYLEHMAFNGSANFPPGSVIPFFQSLGMTFGRDQNAFTSFDQTTYLLALPDTRPETIDKGLLFLSDVAMRLSLTQVEVDNERQIILEEKRARSGAQQRVQDEIYARLAPESTFGRRLPIGTEETIKAVGSQDFKDYYSRWYVPSNMTLIAVGDTEPATLAALIRKHFDAGAKAQRPSPQSAGVKAQNGMRAIVASDSELTQTDVSIVRIEPPRPPTTTVEQYRRDLMELVATRAFNRRIGALIAEGKAAFIRASASVGQEASAIRFVSVQASGSPGTWRTMLTDLSLDFQRARLHGFSEREVQDVRVSLISQAEEAVQHEATVPARTMLRQLNGAVTRAEPVMSASQRLDLLKRLLPGITAPEVSQVFATVFDPASVTFIGEFPSGPDVPSEAALVALGKVALNVTPDKLVEVARSGALLEKTPSAGTVVERIEHAASGVTSLWLDNGVRVHHRFMAERKNEANIVITLAGGRIQETAANRGITDAAVLAWNRPATGTLSSIQIRDLMTGKKVRVSGAAHEDTIRLGISGNPGEMEAGFQLAYLLLTDPVIEAAVFRQWQESERQGIASRKVQAAGVLSEVTAAAFFPPDEPRARPLETEQVEKITLAAAQAWLRTMIKTAPIEVAVVGDLDRSRAQELVERYFGSLPARDRVSDKTFAGLRTITRSAGPITVERKISVKTPQAFVMDGFFGADVKNVRDSRLLWLAARVLSTRMSAVIREEKQLVYSIRASSEPASEYPGFGLFSARAPTDPAKAEALANAVNEMYSAFAAQGPSDDEMQVARKQAANLLDQGMKEPEFWLSALSVVDYRGLSLDDFVRGPADYQRYTAAEVRDAFNRYYRPDARFRFVITPRE